MVKGTHVTNWASDKAFKFCLYVREGALGLVYSQMRLDGQNLTKFSNNRFLKEGQEFLKCGHTLPFRVCSL